MCFTVLQDLLVDCFKPTEVKRSSSSLLLLTHSLSLIKFTFLMCVFVILSPHMCSVPPRLPRRTSSQSCWTRFEGCRSFPRLRRNDGTLPPPPSPSPFAYSLPPEPSPLRLPATAHTFLLMCVFLPLKIMKCYCRALFLLVVRPSVLLSGCLDPAPYVAFLCCSLDFLHIKPSAKREKKIKE